MEARLAVAETRSPGRAQSAASRHNRCPASDTGHLCRKRQQQPSSPSSPSSPPRGRRIEAEQRGRRPPCSHHRWLLAAAALVCAASLGAVPLQAAGQQQECSRNEHCATRDKICHENRCICARDKPVEDRQGRCLSLALMGDSCSINEQCLSDTQCISGACACGPDSISLLNPSTKIYYCHAKRQLNEECSLDAQCPQNAYCSTKNNGCLCLNGYQQTPVGDGTSQCAPKICVNSSTCESEFHECFDNKCFCMATHFDPHTAKCYRLGSTGGQRPDGAGPADAANSTSSAGPTGSGRVELSFQTLMEDLFKHGDKLWLVVVMLLLVSLVMILLVFMALRRHYLGYCWSAGHKKEYEPNTKNAHHNDHFTKNSINNKSFRKKSEPDVLDTDHEFRGPAADDEHASIIEPSKGQSKNGHAIMKAGGAHHNGIRQNDYVKVNLASQPASKTTTRTDDQHADYQQQRSLLPSSTSTPV